MTAAEGSALRAFAVAAPVPEPGYVVWLLAAPAALMARWGGKRQKVIAIELSLRDGR
jgi:hypothetical protein